MCLPSGLHAGCSPVVRLVRSPPSSRAVPIVDWPATSLANAMCVPSGATASADKLGASRSDRTRDTGLRGVRRSALTTSMLPIACDTATYDDPDGSHDGAYAWP